MISRAGIALAALVVVGTTTADAASISITLGNANNGFTNGSTVTTAAAQAAQAGSPAPFNAVCGSDTVANGSCSASWTFTSLGIPNGDIVTAASLTLGLVDIDSVAANNQVNNYQIVGGDDLTAPLNTAAEAVQSINNQYDVFTLTLTSLGVFNSGSATVNFALQPPGKGVLPAGTVANGGFLIFSTLNLTTAPREQQPTVPEPGSMLLLASGVGILARARARRRTH